MQIHIQFNVHKCSKKSVCINICACIQKAACYSYWRTARTNTESAKSSIQSSCRYLWQRQRDTSNSCRHKVRTRTNCADTSNYSHTGQSKNATDETHHPEYGHVVTQIDAKFTTKTNGFCPSTSCPALRGVQKLTHGNQTLEPPRANTKAELERTEHIVRTQRRSNWSETDQVSTINTRQCLQLRQ